MDMSTQLSTLSTQLSELLEPIAAWFRGMNIPEPITHWGHPAMMATVIFIMGGFVAYAGWQGRTATDTEVAAKHRLSHRKIAPWMFLFLAMGYTGGLLSLVMQEKPLLASPHFWTGSVVLLLLAINGMISITGFAGNKAALRTTHAYLGTVAFALMIIHAVFGLKLGLSI
ncbi:MAG: DUF4079 domain-containing protein [Cyanobacteriota bacterium SKYGB_h_bin112]|nr:DUF4079 domain-containing protein [Cyanobacteriota bacterium SKYGB_h_bin112]